MKNHAFIYEIKAEIFRKTFKPAQQDAKWVSIFVLKSL